MIKFFRHIRKKLLQENRFSKYLLYAAGEIILVVAGILIALYINNLNEDQKTEEFEKNILIEIDRTIAADLDDFKYFEERIKKKDTAIDNLIFARKGDKKFTEDELLNNIGWVHSYIVFSYNKGPYETLKSAGLDKIQSDSLRYKLTYYYEVILPRFTRFFQIDHNEHQPKIKTLMSGLEKAGFYEKVFELSSNGKGFYPITKYNTDKYLTDPQYHDVLVLEANYKYDLWTTIVPLIRQTEEIKQATSLEIQERFKE